MFAKKTVDTLFSIEQYEEAQKRLKRTKSAGSIAIWAFFSCLIGLWLLSFVLALGIEYMLVGIGAAAFPIAAIFALLSWQAHYTANELRLEFTSTKTMHTWGNYLLFTTLGKTKDKEWLNSWVNLPFGSLEENHLLASKRIKALRNRQLVQIIIPFYFALHVMGLPLLFYALGTSSSLFHWPIGIAAAFVLSLAGFAAYGFSKSLTFIKDFAKEKKQGIEISADWRYFMALFPDKEEETAEEANTAEQDSK